MKIDEYSDQFSWQRDVCRLVENDEYYCISFTKGLRPDILTNMKDCTTMHDTYWEAIRVECLSKHYHVWKAKL